MIWKEGKLGVFFPKNLKLSSQIMLLKVFGNLEQDLFILRLYSFVKLLVNGGVASEQSLLSKLSEYFSEFHFLPTHLKSRPYFITWWVNRKITYLVGHLLRMRVLQLQNSIRNFLIVQLLCWKRDWENRWRYKNFFQGFYAKFWWNERSSYVDTRDGNVDISGRRSTV